VKPLVGGTMGKPWLIWHALMEGAQRRFIGLPRMTDAVEEMLNKQPLMLFSQYSAGHSVAVIELGQEILGLLSKNAGPIKNATDFNRGYNLFWFWTLGAYEILRTMKQHQQCFAVPLIEEIRRLEAMLKTIRIPFAKQELKNNGGRIGNEASVFGFGAEQATMIFKINDIQHDATGLIGEVEIFFRGIQRDDVLARMPA
jgi:hypothetical protein